MKKIVGLILALAVLLAVAAVACAEPVTWDIGYVCAAGLPLQDEDPTLTAKWYNAIPIDLTQEGTQTVQLVVANTYYIGTADVTVADGCVTVTYEMNDRSTKVSSEVLQWFTSMDDVTAEFLAEPAGEYAFGEPVSIAQELKSAKVALLYICNKVTYVSNNEKLVRYWANLDQWKAARADMRALMDVMAAQVLVDPVATPTDEEPATPTDVDPTTPTDLDPTTPTDLATPTDIVATITDLKGQDDEPATPTDEDPARPTDQN